MEGGSGDRVPLPDQQLRTEPTRLEQLLTDGRQIQVLRDLDVVIPHDREVIRDAQTGLVGGADDPQRLGVARGEDRRGSSIKREEPTGQLPCLVAAVGTERDELRLDRLAGCRQGALVADVAVPTRGEPEWVVELVTHEADPSVTKFQQVACRCLTTADVVADDVRQSLDRRGVCIDDDHRDGG